MPDPFQRALKVPQADKVLEERIWAIKGRSLNQEQIIYGVLLSPLKDALGGSCKHVSDASRNRNSSWDLKPAGEWRI